MIIANKSPTTDIILPMFTTDISFVSILMVVMLPLSSAFMGTSFSIPDVSSNRALAPGSRDFNDLFENASILIPQEFKVSERVAFIDLDMNIRNIKCYDVSVGDISVNHDQKSNTAFMVTIGVSELDLTCEMDYDYSYGILSGDGWVQIRTKNSEALAAIAFASLGFDENYPPIDPDLDSCFSHVDIEHMDFEEDFASEILEVFQRLIHNTVERAIGDAACEELSIVGTSVFGKMVNTATDHLEPYLGGLGDAITDPLYLEHNLVLQSDRTSLNLQDKEGHMGNTFNEILRISNTILGSSTIDSSQAYADPSSAGNDLLINSFLRSFLLSDDGSLHLDLPLISKMIDPILFEGHDRLTQFTARLESIHVYGLDSITKFNFFRSIGNYTMQNEMAWDILRFKFNMILDIKPSSLDDAILVDPTSSGISKPFSVNFEMNDIAVETSLLLLMNEAMLGSMELGSLLNTENLLPCLLSVIDKVELSGLVIDPSHINDEFILADDLSMGLISDSIEAAFAMYKGSVHAAIPNIFQTNVRQMMNAFIEDAFSDNGTGLKCPEPVSYKEDYIDFRKFFDAKDSSYGDLAMTLKDMLDDRLLTNSPETGRPSVNEILIAPLTVAQSGTIGALYYSDDLFRIQNKNVQFRAYDSKIENLNSVGAPLDILKTISGEAHLLNNTVTFGVGEKPLHLSSKILFSIDSDGKKIFRITGVTL